MTAVRSARLIDGMLSQPLHPDKPSLPMRPIEATDALLHRRRRCVASAGPIHRRQKVRLPLVAGRMAPPGAMDLSNVDLNLLVALDALLAERSVTNAGRRVHLSQSAMSGALARLRQMFNDE